jgi:hypothetical protein
MRRPVAVLVALVVGSLVGAGAVTWRDARTTERPAAETAVAAAPGVTSDRTQAAVDALPTSPLFVSAELADQLDESQRQAVVEALQTAPVPTYLVLTTVSRDARTGNQYDIAEQVAGRLATDGAPARVAVVTQDRQAIVENVGEHTTYADPRLLGGRLPQGMLRYAQDLAGEETGPAYEGGNPEADQFNLAGGDYYGGLVGGFFVGLLYGGGIFLVVLVVAAIGALLLRRRLPEEDR